MRWWCLLLRRLRAWYALRLRVVVKPTDTGSRVRTAARGTIIRRWCNRWRRNFRRSITFFNRCRRCVGDGRHETSNAASALLNESLLLLFYSDHGSDLFHCIGVIALNFKTHYYWRDGCGRRLFWVGSNIDAKRLRLRTAYGNTPLFRRGHDWRGRRRIIIVKLLFYPNV